MATIVTVHGTFAHINEGPRPDGTIVDEHLWWHRDSTFQQKMQATLQASDNGVPVKVEAFVWNGLNSERDRRLASGRLLNRLLELERASEPYVVIGHSHGGSVLSTTMLTAAARRLPLHNMKQWITVGTPFIGMKPMPRLIDRLNLIQRVVLVASMMLLMMFLFFVAGEMLDNKPGVALQLGEIPSGNARAVALRTIISALMMSLPVLFFTVAFRWIDRQSLFYYRKKTVARARAQFGPRWQSLCHASDEAVQGLRSLPQARIQLFDPNFAAQRLTLLAVFALPVAYLTLLASPALMLGIGNLLKTSIYQVQKYDAIDEAFDVERQQIRSAVKAVKPANLPADVQTPGIEWSDLRRMREALKQRYPDYIAIERALRFKHEFLEADGKPCPDGALCGKGRDFAVNSRLLYHVVTDEVSSALVNDDTRFGMYSAAIRVAIPMVVVPAACVLLALLAMVIIGWLARAVSALLATVLNRTTLSEIKREIYGNDTGTEIAYGAGPFPPWMEKGRPYLPAGIADRLTEYANRAALSSLAKFRNAISTIAMSAGKPPDGGIVSSYLTWKELIHSTYLEYSEFQLLVAGSIAQLEGFRATPHLTNDPGFAEAQSWLEGLAATPATTSAGRPGGVRKDA